MTPDDEHVALEDLAIAAERRDALLDARPAGVEEADDRRAVLDRHVLDLGDLLRMRLAERAAEHGEILGEDIDRAAVDGAPAGHHAVARNLGRLHAEIVAAMLDEHVELLERIVVEQEFDALARGELALGVLGRDALLAAAEAGAFAAGVEAGEDVLHGRAPGVGGRRCLCAPLVMAGLVPAIHAIELPLEKEREAAPSWPLLGSHQRLNGVHGRDKPGHDGSGHLYRRA